MDLLPNRHLIKSTCISVSSSIQRPLSEAGTAGYRQSGSAPCTRQSTAQSHNHKGGYV